MLASSYEKISYLDLLEFQKKNASKLHVSHEYCPVFNHSSLHPKLKFSDTKRFCEGQIFEISRKYLSLFGLPAYGVHCNVWSKVGNTTLIHFGQRSKKLKSFPKHLDNAIAGGQPVKLSILDNLKKEAFEEAGLKSEKLNLLKKGNTVRYNHNNKDRLISGIIFNYHLQKDGEMNLKNIDGEVEQFISLPIFDIYQILEKKILKPNCIIPILDFLILNNYEFLTKGTIVELKKELRIL